MTPKTSKKHKSSKNYGTPKISPAVSGKENTLSNVQALSKWQQKKEKRKDKRLVVCTCCFTGKDWNMVQCVHCRKWQHNICYQLFELFPLAHTCGPCSVRLNVPCTSEEIRTFCLLKNKTEQQRRDFVLMLMAQRTPDIFLNNEHLGYNCKLSPNEEFLVIRLEISKTCAERNLFTEKEHDCIRTLFPSKLDYYSIPFSISAMQ